MRNEYRRWTPAPRTDASVTQRVLAPKTKTSVQVRLQGKSEAILRAAAKEMNVAVKTVRPARGGHFYFLYGFKTIEV